MYRARNKFQISGHRGRNGAQPMLLDLRQRSVLSTALKLKLEPGCEGQGRFWRCLKAYWRGYNIEAAPC